ncbi:hypothetical protein [Paraburkholderia sp. J41]|uniref:hypothetical protein n=1 Tax=Paraburkholderia sp. J41 TaxID=2805433 RepID=UPI002AC31581|nr:hypothetical protein [Paraburkholderia sp. J41]
MKNNTMKKISFALLASLFVAAAASAQTPENGIVTTHDANVVSQIEQHARDAQAQPQVVEQDAHAVPDSAPHKRTHPHHHHKKHPAKPAQAPAGE